MRRNGTSWNVRKAVKGNYHLVVEASICCVRRCDERHAERSLVILSWLLEESQKADSAVNLDKERDRSRAFVLFYFVLLSPV